MKGAKERGKSGSFEGKWKGFTQRRKVAKTSKGKENGDGSTKDTKKEGKPAVARPRGTVPDAELRQPAGRKPPAAVGNALRGVPCVTEKPERHGGRSLQRLNTLGSPFPACGPSGALR